MEDDFFNVDDSIGGTKPVLPSEPVKVEEPHEEKEIVAANKGEYPSIVGGGCPANFMSLVDKIIRQYKLLPKIDYDSIYEELRSINMKSCDTPSLQILNREMQRVQASKERVGEIMVDIIRHHTLKKRAIDMLTDSWAGFSEEKSADKRKSEAVYKMGEFELDFSNIDELHKVSGHIMKNLEGLQENLSRRITIWSLQLKLRDIGRDTLPDMTFKDDSSEFDLMGDSKENNDGKAKTVEW